MRPVLSLLAALFAIVSLASAPATLAGQEPITPDRPGIGSGATVLAPGLVHLESGASLNSGTGVDQYAIGELLVRAGISGIELQLFGNSLVVQRSEELPVLEDEGFQDVGIGLKVPLLRDVGERMNLSVQGVLTAPTGSALFTNDEWVGSLSALADVSLSDVAGVSLNLGIEEGVGTSDAVVSAVVTPGISLGGGVGAYGGWAGYFVEGGDVNYGEAGLTYLASNDVQLDVNGGWGLDTDEWFLGAGVAVRWGADR